MIQPGSNRANDGEEHKVTRNEKTEQMLDVLNRQPHLWITSVILAKPRYHLQEAMASGLDNPRKPYFRQQHVVVE